MDDKIKEVQFKLTQLQEKKTGFFIDDKDIMKGSTLNINIIDGHFEDTFFDSSNF